MTLMDWYLIGVLIACIWASNWYSEQSTLDDPHALSVFIVGLLWPLLAVMGVGLFVLRVAYRIEVWRYSRAYDKAMASGRIHDREIERKELNEYEKPALQNRKTAG